MFLLEVQVAAESLAKGTFIDIEEAFNNIEGYHWAMPEKLGVTLVSEESG